MTGIERANTEMAASVLEAAALNCADGWTQGVMARNRKGAATGHASIDATCWCASGAIIKAMADIVGVAASAHRWNAVLSRAEHMLRGLIFLRYTSPADTDTDDRIAEWNDNPERTQGEVVALLYLAAGMLLERLHVAQGVTL